MPKIYTPSALRERWLHSTCTQDQAPPHTQEHNGLRRRHGLRHPGRERRAGAHRQGRGRAPRGALLQAGAWPSGCHAERAHGGVHQGRERVGLCRPGRARVPDARDARDGQGREGPLLQDAGHSARGGCARHVAARAALRLLQGLPADDGDRGHVEGDQRARPLADGRGPAQRREGARGGGAGQAHAQPDVGGQVRAARGLPLRQGPRRGEDSGGGALRRRQPRRRAPQVPEARLAAQCGARHNRGPDGGAAVGGDRVRARRVALPAAAAQGLPQRGAQGETERHAGGDGQPPPRQPGARGGAPLRAARCALRCSRRAPRASMARRSSRTRSRRSAWATASRRSRPT